ncbi:MAG TPA: GNAT family N-acetyltransferase [Dongiaceae bacterium]
MTPALRRAIASDAEAVAALTREAYAKWIAVIGRAPKPMTADYDVAIRKHRIDVLDEDGGLVALIETIRETDHLLIENVEVSPSRQGKGYGRLLMAHAETLVKSLGQTEIRLYTNKLFAENIAFYRKLGYRVYLEEPYKGGTITHMRKRI